MRLSVIAASSFFAIILTTTLSMTSVKVAADTIPKFETLTILDENSSPVLVKDLWREHTAVLVFLRHFG